MHLSPKSWIKRTNTINIWPKSISSGKQEAPYEYCDELFQNVNTQTNDVEDTSINNSFDLGADNEENVFAQCHQQLHSINLCVEYQQTIKDEMKKLAKLEHAIYQKTSSHAQRLSQIASTMSPDQETDWITRELDSLADQVAYNAQAHHKNAVTMSGHCNAIQQALDAHHEVMTSIHSRNLNKAWTNPALQSSPDVKNAGVTVAVAVPGNPHRIPSPRKTTTLAAANIKEGQEGKLRQSLQTAGMFNQSPRRGGVTGACTEAAQREMTAGKEKERSRMTYLHAYCLFEDIRKPRLVLANKIEYLRTQQISIMQQLQDEDSTISCLRETTQDKNRPWYAQVRLEESLSLREFLGEHGRQLENHMTEAMNALEGFDFQHKDKLADILKVFALYRVGHYSNLKRTLMLMKYIFLQDKTSIHQNHSTENDEVLTSNLWLPTEDNFFITMDTQSNNRAEYSESIERPSATEGNYHMKPLKISDSNKPTGVAEDMSLEALKIKNADFLRSAMSLGKSNQSNIANLLAVEDNSKYIESDNIPIADKVSNTSKGLWENPTQEISRTSGCKSDDKMAQSNELENSRPRKQHELPGRQVDMPSTPSPTQNYLSRKECNEAEMISPLRPSLTTSPNVPLGRNGKINNSTSPDSLNSETYDGDNCDRSSSVDGPTYRPCVSSKALFSSERPIQKMSKGRHTGVVRENLLFGKSPGERENHSSSVDFTNNHEMAMLSRYIPSERLSSHEELAVRDVSQLYRQKSKERLLNSSENPHSLMSRFERELDKDDSDLKARKYIGKYVTQQRHLSVVGRDQVRNKYPFRKFEPFNKNGNSQRNSNGIGWEDQSRVGRRADNFSEAVHSLGISEDKDLRSLDPKEYLSWKKPNVDPSTVRTQQTGDKIIINKKRKKDNAYKEKGVRGSDSFTISYPTNTHAVWTSEGYNSGSRALTEACDKSSQEDKNNRKTDDSSDDIGISVNEASNQSTDSQKQKDIPRGFDKTLGTSIMCRRSTSSSSLDVTPNKQSVQSEIYGEANDDSEWETESVSMLTSVSLASSQVPLQMTQLLIPARESVNDLASGSHVSRNSQKSARNAGQNSKPKVLKRVCFADKVHYNNIATEGMLDE